MEESKVMLYLVCIENDNFSNVSSTDFADFHR
jgi:hypothetical protein